MISHVSQFLLLCILRSFVSQDFAWVQITGERFLITDQFLSDTHIGEPGPAAVKYYQQAVVKLNELIDQENIVFAFHTGDLTDSAMKQQWEESKKITSAINTPVLPLLGNHDIWSYNSTWEEKSPTGDLQFSQHFGDWFHPKIGNLNNYTGNLKTWNPEHSIYSYFQNFVFEYEGVVFLCLDWNSRHHAVSSLGYKGSMPGAELHNFAGGTFNWLDSRLAELSTRLSTIKQIFFIQHEPFRCPVYIPCDLFSWSVTKGHDFRELIKKHKIPLDKIWGDVSGHIHQWHYWEAWELEWGKQFMEWQTSAMKLQPQFTIFHMKDGKLDQMKKIILDKL